MSLLTPEFSDDVPEDNRAEPTNAGHTSAGHGGLDSDVRRVSDQESAEAESTEE